MSVACYCWDIMGGVGYFVLNPNAQSCTLFLANRTQIPNRDTPPDVQSREFQNLSSILALNLNSPSKMPPRSSSLHPKAPQTHRPSSRQKVSIACKGGKRRPNPNSKLKGQECRLTVRVYRVYRASRASRVYRVYRVYRASRVLRKSWQRLPRMFTRSKAWALQGSNIESLGAPRGMWPRA